MDIVSCIVERKLITSIEDIFDLNIIDWNRLYSWKNALEAARTLSSWLSHKAHYTVIAHDLTQAPCIDWPGWHHVGGHDQLGKFYWNDFHAHQQGELMLGDEPDLAGSLLRPNGSTAHFWGDVGICSAQVFALTLHKMDAHDLWISVLNEHTQVIIEPFVSLKASWDRQFARYVTGYEPPTVLALPEKPSRKKGDLLTLPLWG